MMDADPELMSNEELNLIKDKIYNQVTNMIKVLEFTQPTMVHCDSIA